MHGTIFFPYFRCDGVVDCPGSLHEDESEACIEENIEESCLQYKMKGNTGTGNYNINPGGLGMNTKI